MKLPMKKMGILFGLIAAVAVGLLAFASTDVTDKAATATINTSSANTAKAVIAVEGMSCGGCVATINGALADFEGIEDIRVDVAGGRADVVYRVDVLRDIDKLAEAITDSGYPAKVVRIVNAAEMQKQRLHAKSKALTTIATVGTVEISRDAFNTELAHARSRYESLYGTAVFSDQRGKRLLGNIKVQIIQRLIADAIKLSEIEQAGFTVEDALVNRWFEAYLAKQGLSREAFVAMLENNGYPADFFMRKFRDRVRIESYVEQKVYNGLTTDIEKQKRYAEWFANARLLAQVDYFDKDLERQVGLSAGSGACGNSCSANQ